MYIGCVYAELSESYKRWHVHVRRISKFCVCTACGIFLRIQACRISWLLRYMCTHYVSDYILLSMHALC